VQPLNVILNQQCGYHENYTQTWALRPNRYKNSMKIMKRLLKRIKEWAFTSTDNSTCKVKTGNTGMHTYSKSSMLLWTLHIKEPITKLSNCGLNQSQMTYSIPLDSSRSYALQKATHNQYCALTLYIQC